MKYLVFIFGLFVFNLAYGQTASQYRVLTKTDGINDFGYRYDEQGRLSQRGNNNWGYHESFVYRNDSVFVYAVQMPDSALYQVYKIGKNGLAESSCVISGTDYFCEYYKFDDRLMKKKYHHYPVDGQTVEYDIKDGNQVKEYFFDSSFMGKSLMVQQTLSEYSYSNQPNPLTNEMFGQAYLGRTNKFLLSKSSSTSANTGVCDKMPCLIKPETTEKQEISYEYIFDDKGRISQEIKTFVGTSKKIITKYTYY